MIEPSACLDFADRCAWRSWLEDHHATCPEAWLVIQKTNSESVGLRYDQAVEEALCYGWIDGKLLSLDDRRYLLRFSPRRPNSVWAVNNLRRVERLVRAGAMTEAGLSAIRDAKEGGQWQAALDRERTEEIPAELEAALRREKGALAAYRALPDSLKKRYVYWIQQAKRERTRFNRAAKVVKQVLRARSGG
jgi:uncharacterized protein YdeI (YjbR/CyaY-like superfamily)